MTEGITHPTWDRMPQAEGRGSKRVCLCGGSGEVKVAGTDKTGAIICTMETCRACGGTGARKQLFTKG